MNPLPDAGQSVPNAVADRLLAVVRRLSYLQAPDEIMATVRKAVRDLVGADGATFVLREGDRVHYADEDAIQPLWKGQRFPIDGCISGWSILHRTPVVIEDVYSDPRVPIAAYRPTFVKSLALVPIRPLDPLGAIGAYWAGLHRATPAEVGMLEAVADATAISFANARLYEEVQRELAERRKVESQLQSLNLHLEKKVSERTRTLEEALQELDLFASTVSHDLRAPLRSIRGLSQILVEDGSDRLLPEHCDLLRKIIGSADRMHALIEGLLAYSRISREQVRLQDVRLEEVVDLLLWELRDEIEERRAELRVERPMPSARAHPMMFQQALANLIRNAIKFVAPGRTPQVRIRAEIHGGSVRLWVEDAGIGIPAEHHGRIFQ
ncbi:MAG TPA: histidine kinase dimerization/phospho-acceptor domain-containing protein, partial [Planctomycetota bacterium]|nr:histidine kinase dimerization/phospho-acceptor domain-containing protein [Planctomycetota bacterium]